MCIICTHIDAGKLDPWEAARNRRELLPDLDEEHLKILDEKINKALLDYLDRLTVEDDTTNLDT